MHDVASVPPIHAKYVQSGPAPQTRLLRRGLVLEIQFPPVGKDDLCTWISGSDVGDRLAVLGWTENDGHYVTSFQGASGPACARQDYRTVSFNAPVDDVA